VPTTCANRGAVVPKSMRLLVRFNLCCSREGCRRRKLPPATRFDGPRVYWGCAILISQRQGREHNQGHQIHAQAAVDGSSVEPPPG